MKNGREDESMPKSVNLLSAQSYIMAIDTARVNIGFGA